jgi:hypothetical protein
MNRPDFVIYMTNTSIRFFKFAYVQREGFKYDNRYVFWMFNSAICVK